MSALRRVISACLLAGAVSAFMTTAAHADDFMVLWWQVGDKEDWSDDGESLQDVTVQGVNGAPSTTAYDLGVNAARIRATSGDTVTYLSMLNPAAQLNPTIVSFDTERMNVPTIWQADITDFTSGSPEYSFVIELGNWDGSAWSTLAVSETVSYSDLNDIHHAIAQSNGTYNPNYADPWVATSYVVPEPTSGMLILVGAALLALRRRRGALRRG